MSSRRIDLLGAVDTALLVLSSSCCLGPRSLATLGYMYAAPIQVWGNPESAGCLQRWLEVAAVLVFLYSQHVYSRGVCSGSLDTV